MRVDAICNVSSLKKEEQPGEAALPCDAWHPYYHYQSSAQYLWLAETLRALDRIEEARHACDRAMFQDHLNEEACAGKQTLGQTRDIHVPAYGKHPLYDREFCSRIGELPNDATKLHDEAVAAWLAGDLPKALARVALALDAAPQHGNSFFLRGKCHFSLGRLEEARADFTEAIRLSHLRHDIYHRMASAQHLARGRGFMNRGDIDLALNAFTKALDLDKENKQARAGRAQAWRVKGNFRQADEEEKLL